MLIVDDLKDIEKFLAFSKILVTGPQRSGTRIATKIIANLLDYAPYYEDKVANKGVFHCIENVLEEGSVLQFPEAAYNCHLAPKEVLVVFMIRPTLEIIASDIHRMKTYKRGGSGGQAVKSVFMTQRPRYVDLYGLEPDHRKHDIPGYIYHYWKEYQKLQDFNWAELEYSCLKQHEFWIDLKDRRANFKSGVQIEIEHRLQ